ncbi:hypothetical protein GCM10011415_27570 [Salipiger pallidus]|uniref:histidine kinase n=1 Tax=Salipiger pallidus TaxID=1775170 RepID=A0A8J2ZKY1_9RHOB|nr:transporter substrate-binding domain-containing protein [Salipiger pallidus]GGG77177.1 hypothetical protein GCM10011415_27570 [Salipiger pallidus]
MLKMDFSGPGATTTAALTRRPRPVLAPVLALVLVALSVLVLPAASSAQVEEDTLLVPWAPVPGVYETQADGSLGGFFADLAVAVADHAGLSLEFVEYPDFSAAVAAQAAGDTDLLAGIVDLPILRSATVLSDPVTQIPVHLFVRSDAPLSLLPGALDGRRIGVLREMARDDLAGVSGLAEMVSFDTMTAAFGALLSGELDGMVALNKPAADYIRAARIEPLVRIAGEALRREDHYVSVSRDHTDLLPRINTAIATLVESGEMQRILVRWNMVPPDPVPEVLSVGVTPFPPYQVITPEGEFTGFGVEALRQIARRAGLSLVFREITSAQWAEGPAPGRYDLLPPISMTEQRRHEMDFTRAIQQSPYAIFLEGEDTREVANLADLVGLRVGVVEYNLARNVAAQQDGIELVEYGSKERLLNALIADEVEAVLYSAATLRELARDRGVLGQIREVSPPFMVSARAIALRFGLVQVRERLDAMIPGYLSSEEYSRLRERWLGTPGFWTPQRVWLALFGGLVLALAIVAAFLWQSRRARNRLEGQASELERLSARLGAVLATTRSGIIGLRPDGLIAVANPGAMEMLELGDTDWPVPWPSELRFVEPESAQPLEASADPVRRALAGATLRYEPAILRPEGAGDIAELRHVRVSCSQVAARERSDVTTVVVIDDVTELETKRQQIERAGRLDALGQLTGGVAHDFNNILGTIEYAVELASMGANERDRKFLDKALGSVQRGNELTSRLLSFAKRQPGSRRKVQMAEVMTDLRNLAGPVIEKSVMLEFKDVDPGLAVFCDLGQLENALLNLLLNSRDAILSGGASGTIRVSATRTGRRNAAGVELIEICVSDDGPGMTPEVKSRATDPFFTTKSRGKGTGLGLSIVYGFVEQAEGDLQIISEPGEGTTICMLLPEAEAPDDTIDAESEDAPLGNGERILVAEDEADLLEMTSEILRRLGYEVHEAASGGEALDLAVREGPFDLVLSDVVMPGGMGGFELAQEVRLRWPSLPVLYMSGYTGITKESMGSVVAPVLRKPCGRRDLAWAIRKMLDRAE